MTQRSTNTRDDAEIKQLNADVAIVGAGPAGGVLAHLLARSGIETVLIERRHDLSRDFRGYGFQPPVLRLFEDLGLLDEILEIPHQKLQSGNIVAYDRAFKMFDWRKDSDSFDFALQMDQGPLLELLIEEVNQQDRFTYLAGTTANDLVRQDGVVVGVEATERPSGNQLRIRSRVVVGADGRFSMVRDRAGIHDGKGGSDLELLWFKLSSSPTPIQTHLRIADSGVLVYAPLDENEGQYGVFIEGGTYPEVREQGIDAFRERVSAIEPELTEAIREDLESFDDCALLDIEPGIALAWRRDGLLLIGDAAHIASPFGEGNVLAMHDAASAHPTIIEALRRSDGELPKESLAEFEQTRRKMVEDSMENSAHMQGLMSFVTGDSPLPKPVQRIIVRNLFRTMGFVTGLTDHVPHGIDDDQYVAARSSLFVD